MKIHLLIILMLIISGCDLFTSKSMKGPEPVMQKNIDEQGSGMQKNEENESGIEKDNKAEMKKTIEYKDWNQADYDAALAANKVVFLEFWASWCPICRAMEPQIRAAFNELDEDEAIPRDIIGFKVNYDTNSEMNRKYGISSQHTHIIIDRNGAVTYRSLVSFGKEELKAQILKVSNG